MTTKAAQITIAPSKTPSRSFSILPKPIETPAPHWDYNVDGKSRGNRNSYSSTSLPDINRPKGKHDHPSLKHSLSRGYTDDNRYLSDFREELMDK